MGVLLLQSMGNRRPDRVMNPFLVAESHFIFCRMNIDIHSVKRNPDKQHRHGELAFDKPSGISLKQSMLYHPIPGSPSIDIDVHTAGCFACDRRRRKPPFQLQISVVVLNGYESFFQLRSQYMDHPVCRVGYSYPVFQQFIVVKQFELNPGPPQGHGGNHIGDVTHFGLDTL